MIGRDRLAGKSGSLATSGGPSAPRALPARPESIAQAAIRTTQSRPATRRLYGPLVPKATRLLRSAEALDEAAGVELLPTPALALAGEVAVELDERVHEVAPHRRLAELLRELGEAQQPVRIPGGPVGIVAVRDPVDDVVRLGGLVQELGDPRGALAGAHRG